MNNSLVKIAYSRKQKQKLKIFLFSVFALLFSVKAFSQSRPSWYTVNFKAYCGDYTPSGVYITDVDAEKCRATSPTRIQWYFAKERAFCGEFTADGVYVREISDFNVCRTVSPTKPAWYEVGGRAYCAERTNQELYVRELDHNDCRTGKLFSSQAAKPVVQVLSINEINSLLQPPVGAQIVLSADMPVPSNQGCSAPVESSSQVQCYVCQSAKNRNSMLYTKDGILTITAAELLENRMEIRMTLVDSEDLGSIRCLSKDKSEIKLNSFVDIKNFLESSGLKYIEPAPIVKSIGKKEVEP
jgi:hypothetical protein